MRCIDELSPAELRDKRVLVRAGLDVSLGSHGEVTDEMRIRKSIPTLKFLSDAGARVIILSHIGRDPSLTNAPVADALKKFIPLFYVPDLFGTAAQDAITTMRAGEILMLENLRREYDL
ncbi:phosphoglycerate kinase, partial [Candidatus Kaiserbacteria bacterium]|nr:phosphoglycerate kinase [Candidatus Kaiserbacteria bacterium]